MRGRRLIIEEQRNICRSEAASEQACNQVSNLPTTDAFCRLKAIRQAAGDVTPAAPPAAAEQPKLKFRNYNVRDQKIEHTVLEPAKAPEYVATKPEVPAGKTAEV